MDRVLRDRDRVELGGTVFVDPDGYRRFVERKERQFRDELARQRAAAGGEPERSGH